MAAVPRSRSERSLFGKRISQTHFALFAGFGGLLLLLAILGLSAVSSLSQTRVQEEAIRRAYIDRNHILQNLRSGIYTSGTWVRDFLLDPSDAFAEGYRNQFLDSQRQIRRELADFRRLTEPDQQAEVDQLSGELNRYLDALAPVLNWNAAERHARAYAFMQDELQPRRMSALSIADEVQRISERQLEQNSIAVSSMLLLFRSRLLLLLLLTAVAGLILAGVALWRLLSLERETQRRYEEVVGTREELKRLSAELVSAQENERRRISRELHDEVGQVLSAAMLGLGSLRSALRDGNSAEALHQLQLVEDMTERNASMVRNISLLLRPTMLDDLGLIPALKWLAREVTRSTSLEVEIDADAFADDLPDSHRTCVFRVVQEALRNAVRHSGARCARITVEETKAEEASDNRMRRLRLSVQDDGKGFTPSLERGLGILGMQERVIGLGGTMNIQSHPGKVTILTVELPLPVARGPQSNTSEAGSLQEINPLRTA